MLQLMLTSGMLISICINIFTGDILKIVFDKYLMGKLLSEFITDGKFIDDIHGSRETNL